MNVELSIVIPALNESKIIRDNVDEVAHWIRDNMPDVSYEILVVDDGSTDGMSELLNEAQTTRPWLKVARHPVNLGRGKGVRTGFENTSGKFVICLDADLSYSPSVIKDLYEPLRDGVADISLASAHHPEGDLVNVPAQRAFLSKWGNAMLGAGFDKNFHTVTCIVRGFTRDVADELELVSDGKELHLEVIQKAQLLGMRFIEIPAILKWRDKKRGQRKKIIPEIAIFKMRRTVLSHLVFNYMTNPGILLLIPIAVLLSISITALGILSASFFTRLAQTDLALMDLIRAVLVDGELSLTLLIFSSITLMIFCFFYLLSYQSKRYFEENYTLLMRMNNRLKRIERDCAGD